MQLFPTPAPPNITNRMRSKSAILLSPPAQFAVFVVLSTSAASAVCCSTASTVFFPSLISLMDRRVLYFCLFHCFVYSGIFLPSAQFLYLSRSMTWSTSSDSCAWQRRSRGKLICALMSAFTLFLFTFFFASAKFNWMIDRSICNCTLIKQTTRKKGGTKGRNKFVTICFACVFRRRRRLLLLLCLDLWGASVVSRVRFDTVDVAWLIKQTLMWLRLICGNIYFSLSSTTSSVFRVSQICCKYD